MRKPRFSRQQIINILKQAYADVKGQNLFRHYGISDVTYRKWKSRCGGME
jgi:putative transposase